MVSPTRIPQIISRTFCSIHTDLKQMHPHPHPHHHCPLPLSLILIITTTLTTATTSLAPARQQQEIQILPGSSSLHASAPQQTWPSISGTFSLGFIPTTPPTDPPSFTASIIYSGGVPVWSAGNGIPVDSGGSLQFLSTGNLRLVHGSGDTLWESGTAGLGVTSSILDDSGNLILKNLSSAVWSSFEHPTDTLLAGQVFNVGKVLKSGQYSFTLLRTGNLTLGWNETVVYWNRGVNSSIDGNPWKNVVKGFNPRLNLSVNLRSPSLELQAVGILSISDPVLSSPVIMAYSSDYAEGNDVLRFLKLGDDGNLRIYSSAKGSGTATMRWAALQDQCEVFGYCGNMGICFHSDFDKQDNPSCECPSRNFEPVDPKDARKGCRRKVELENCPGNSTMLELNHTRFSKYQPESAAGNHSRTLESISSTCEVDCLKSNACVASSSMDDGMRTCYTQSSDFFGGYRVSALPSTLYVKVCGDGLPNLVSSSQRAPKNKNSALEPSLLVAVIVPSVLAFVIFQIAFWWWYRRNSSVLGRSLPQYVLLEYVSGAPVQFLYKELQKATKGFKDSIGAGGFGATYQGVLANGSVVAVKRLNESDLGETDFRMKVLTICSTHHVNLVRLIGYCSVKSERLLVYELMKNGSLGSFLFPAEEEKSSRCLSWEQRFNIALGSAKAIAYLHEECRECIIHSNIKPENILLDENYNAKVSDFCLTELIHPQDSRDRAISEIRGMRGYLAPEWLANLPATSKSDVYSFGMVLLEIVSGRRNYEISANTRGLKFSTWAHKELQKGNVHSIMDRRLAESDIDAEQVQRVVTVSLWCTREQPSERPTMGKVVQMLEGDLKVKQPPALEPAYGFS